MNLIELQDTLQNLTKAKITQEEIGKALGITRSTVNARMKSNSQLKIEELPKIEKHFGVDLTNLKAAENFYTLSDKLLKIFEGSEQEKAMLEAILTSKPTRKTFVLFYRAINGEEEAITIIKSMLEKPEIVKVFLEQE